MKQKIAATCKWRLSLLQIRVLALWMIHLIDHYNHNLRIRWSAGAVLTHDMLATAMVIVLQSDPEPVVDCSQNSSCQCPLSIAASFYSQHLSTELAKTLHPEVSVSSRPASLACEKTIPGQQVATVVLLRCIPFFSVFTACLL